MIAHIVLIAPRDALSGAERQAILDTVLTSVGRCPTVRGCRIGRRVRHGLPGYEQAMHENYEYTLLLEFDDVQGLTAYLAHPEHRKLGEIFAQEAASALAYDYELFAVGRHPVLEHGDQQDAGSG